MNIEIINNSLWPCSYKCLHTQLTCKLLRVNANSSGRSVHMIYWTKSISILNYSITNKATAQKTVAD